MPTAFASRAIDRPPRPSTVARRAASSRIALRLRSPSLRRLRAVCCGDFSEVATTIVLVAERLADATDLRAGTRVLDVATGSGNAAIAAARLGCRVTGADYVPALLERGRERAAAERLDIEFVEGDAEALPFDDDAF